MIAIDDIRSMDLKEKILLLETVWAEISIKPDQIEVPQWHKNVLDSRESLIKEGKAVFLDWEDAKKQIQDKIR